jgi:hypothetical protein
MSIIDGEKNHSNTIYFIIYIMYNKYIIVNIVKIIIIFFKFMGLICNNKK